MLLTSVILILQEILEASLIISVLLAFSVQRGITRRWIVFGLAAGLAVAVLYASEIDRVSEWFDYVGLEIVNGTIQYGIFGALVLFAALRITEKYRPLSPLVWQFLMTVIVTLAIAREGFEILLYESGFIGNVELWTPVLLGSLLGAGIGISIGALLYYGLISLPRGTGAGVLLFLLTLFGGNMAAQGTLLFIQADWLPSGHPLWDSSWLITEDSLLGQLLYALVGYEASPSALQAAAYGVSSLTLAILFSLSWQRAHTETSGH